MVALRIQWVRDSDCDRLVSFNRKVHKLNASLERANTLHRIQASWRWQRLGDWSFVLLAPLVMMSLGMGLGIHLGLNRLPTSVGCDSESSLCWWLRQEPKVVIPAKRVKELQRN
jgi:hypothetical protein